MFAWKDLKNFVRDNIVLCFPDVCVEYGFVANLANKDTVVKFYKTAVQPVTDGFGGVNIFTDHCSIVYILNFEALISTCIKVDESKCCNSEEDFVDGHDFLVESVVSATLDYFADAEVGGVSNHIGSAQVKGGKVFSRVSFSVEYCLKRCDTIMIPLEEGKNG